MEYYVGIDVSQREQRLRGGRQGKIVREAKVASEVGLLETRHVKAALPAMTDRKDARGITQLLRMG